MPKRAKKPRKTKSGKVIPPAPHRVLYAVRALSRVGYSATRNAIMKRWEVSHTTAEKDIALAYKQIADDAETERPKLRARETVRMTRIAAAAEREGEYNAAVQASARIAKINGLDVDVVSVAGVTPEQQAMLQAMAMTPYQRRQRMEQLQRQLPRPATKSGAGRPPVGPEDA